MISASYNSHLSSLVAVLHIKSFKCLVLAAKATNGDLEASRLLKVLIETFVAVRHLA